MSDQTSITEPFLIKLKAVIDSDPQIIAAGLATKAGLNNAAIRQWFNGKHRSPTLASARKVCAALDTTLEEFISEAETEDEKAIVRLTTQLSDDLRRKLLAYGEGLVAGSGQNNSIDQPADQ